MLMPKNDTARLVLDHLPCGREPIGSYFNTQSYCIGVPVRDVAEAFELGKSMGAEETRFGDVSFDKQGYQLFLVFKDAHVSQG